MIDTREKEETKTLNDWLQELDNTSLSLGWSLDSVKFVKGDSCSFRWCHCIQGNLEAVGNFKTSALTFEKITEFLQEKNKEGMAEVMSIE